MSKHKILIADDHELGLELLEAYLSDGPYELRTAVNGDEALQLATEWHPDLILLDVMMPKISGFEVCQRLRQNSELANTRILLVTALDQNSDLDRAVEAGADDLLNKPVAKNDLLFRVEAALKAPVSNLGLERTLAYLQQLQ